MSIMYAYTINRTFIRSEFQPRKHFSSINLIGVMFYIYICTFLYLFFFISVENTESVNKLAERVLLRLHQKLQGIEDGVQLSVSGQVNLLIQQARDPKNLAKLFPGWQPYI